MPACDDPPSGLRSESNGANTNPERQGGLRLDRFFLIAGGRPSRPPSHPASRTVSWSSELLFNSILDRELRVPSVPSVFALGAVPRWRSPGPPKGGHYVLLIHPKE